MIPMDSVSKTTTDVQLLQQNVRYGYILSSVTMQLPAGANEPTKDASINR